MSVCIYQADPVVQIEHDNLMMTTKTICFSCSHYTASKAVLVPCAAAADQHALPIKFCTMASWSLLWIVLKVRDKSLGACCLFNVGLQYHVYAYLVQMC